MSYIYFYSNKNNYKYFSQWYLYSFSVKTKFLSNLLGNYVNDMYKEDKIIIDSAEHWMMLCKAILFKDYNIVNKIINNKISTKRVKQYGRKVKNFDTKLWNKYKFIFVVIGNIHKFSKHLKHYLCDTKNKILVEASPYDKIWGIGINIKDAQKGKKWKGQNLLGKALEISRLYLNKYNDINLNLILNLIKKNY